MSKRAARIDGAAECAYRRGCAGASRCNPRRQLARPCRAVLRGNPATWPNSTTPVWLVAVRLGAVAAGKHRAKGWGSK